MAQMIRKFRQNRILKNNNALDLIPSQLEIHEVSDNKLVVILVKRFKSSLLNQIFNKSDYFRIKLDKMGSEVWLLIDGKRNIQTIVSVLLEKDYPDQELAERVVAFITDLYRKDLVKLSITIEKENR